MKSRNKRILSVILAFAAASGAWAQDLSEPKGAPLEYMCYQGRLQVDGLPANGDYDIGFRIFDKAKTGNMLWSDILPVTATEGLFTAYLPLDPAIYNGQGLYLEMEIGGNILLPRQSIPAAPYARSLLPGAQIGGSENDGELYLNYADGSPFANFASQDGLFSIFDDNGCYALKMSAPSTELTIGGQNAGDPAGNIRVVQNGTSYIALSAKYARIKVGNNSKTGKIEVIGSSGLPVVYLNAQDGTLIAGCTNTAGSIEVRNVADETTVEASGEYGLLDLGGPGQDGDLRVRDSEDIITGQLDGAAGMLILGATGQDGDLYIRNDTNDITFQVDGQSGEATWAPQTRYIALSPTVCRPYTNATQYSCHGTHLFTTSDTFFVFHADLQAPHGAKLTNMTFYWNDQAALDATLSLSRSNYGSSSTTIALISTSGNEDKLDSASTAFSLTVDNNASVYYLTLTLPPGINFYGAKIKYTMTGAH